MARPYPGPYAVSEDDQSNAWILLSWASPGPVGNGVHIGHVVPVRADPFGPPTAAEVAQARATAELFAKADVLLKCVEELLPAARKWTRATEALNFNPVTERAAIDRAEAVVAALKGAK